MSDHRTELTYPGRRSTRFIAAQLTVTFVYCVGLPGLLWLLGSRGGFPLLEMVCATVIVAGLGDAFVALRTIKQLAFDDGFLSVETAGPAGTFPVRSVSIERPPWLRLVFKDGSVLRSREHGLWVFVPSAVADAQKLAQLLGKVPVS